MNEYTIIAVNGGRSLLVIFPPIACIACGTMVAFLVNADGRTTCACCAPE